MPEKCIVCEKPVAKQDKVCGNCGTPIDRNEGLRNIVGNIVITFFFIFMIGGIIWLFNYLMA